MAEVGETLYSWQAEEFPRVERGKGWYLWVGLVGLALLVLLIWTRQWTGLLVLVMLAVVVWLMERIQPRQFTHTLTDQGLLLGEKFLAYNELRSFWIVATPVGGSLNFAPNRRFGMTLTLQLGEANVEHVREILADHLPEEPNRGEDLVDRIGRFFKL